MHLAVALLLIFAILLALLRLVRWRLGHFKANPRVDCASGWEDD